MRVTSLDRAARLTRHHHPPTPGSTRPLTRSAATIQVIVRRVTTQHHVQEQLCVALIVDGIQGGTWAQVHLLGTAALERFTGYTGQSRSRHATHTWNVTRLPEIDHGGVLADQRTPEEEVLDALRRLPDTGFAVHDTPIHAQRLLAERAELQAVLRQRPPDRRHALQQAQLALVSAQKELHWANYRLHAAEDQLNRLRPLSQLRRQGRQRKTSLDEDVKRFAGDVQRAEAKLARCGQDLKALPDEVAQRRRWDAQHGWPETRLQSIDAELAKPSRPGKHLNGMTWEPTRDVSSSRLADQRHLTEWSAQLPEISHPPLPGRDPGHGIDLGL